MSEQNTTEMGFHIHRIYVKDISFEAPNLPRIFEKEWEPEVNLNLEVASSLVADDNYEVVLKTTVVAKVGEENAFLCEVHQAGLFNISGLDESQLAHCLGAYCPNLLFPYVRETIATLVGKGTFPQLHLAPVNFDALFMNQLQQQAEKSGTQQDA